MSYVNVHLLSLNTKCPFLRAQVKHFPQYSGFHTGVLVVVVVCVCGGGGGGRGCGALPQHHAQV